jgi:hypothetical protein
MTRLCLRSLTVFAFPAGFRAREIKPCCAPIFIRIVDWGRPSSVSVKPCQPDILRYNQTDAADMISVTKNIATSASIHYLLKTSPHYRPVKRLPIAQKGHHEINLGDFVVTGNPQATFPCQKFFGRETAKPHQSLVIS